MTLHKTILLSFLFLSIQQITNAQIYKNSDKGINISFFSETPVENISAVSKTASSILNFNNDTIVLKMQIVSFKFKNSLMEEHFNENYLESDKYPTATFRGKIDQALDPKVSGKHSVKVSGILEIHGVKQNRVLDGTIEFKDNTVIIHSAFDVKLVDHKIEVPQIVFSKIAEIVKVTVDGTYIFFK